MPNVLRILFVHGVGNQQADTSWQGGWEDAARAGLKRWEPQADPVFDYVMYDDLFAAEEITAAGTAEAVIKLLGSGAVSAAAAVGDAVSGAAEWIGGLFGGRRGWLDTMSDRARWTAGMVVQWAENERLQRRCRQRVVEKINAFRPDVVAAHSLGSLLCYDSFSHPDTRGSIAGKTFVSFGSQIGNWFVKNTFAGRLRELDQAARWYHLYNARDNVFTAPIRIVHPTFEQVNTPSDVGGLDAHDAVRYLGHANTVDRVWRCLAAPAAAPGVRALTRAAESVAAAVRPPAHRALIVGINNYRGSIPALAGCVNNAFMVSSVLQELKFPADGIRLLLDERATAAAIRERLAWLLDDVRPGERRVFAFSGHGAQLPTYNAAETVDGVDECLVPVDFDWSAARAITDDEFALLTADLPYGVEFYAFLDCCHSGGMSRSGGAVRGVDAPDDVRHRMMRWDKSKQMWRPRRVTPLNRKIASEDVENVRRRYAGAAGVTRRIGRSMSLRGLPTSAYDKVRALRGHSGPFLPVLIEACGEGESAQEYQHGAASYGAFTFCLAKVFREMSRTRPPTLHQLVAAVKEELQDFGFGQTPQLLGPEKILSQPLGVVATRAASRGKSKRR
ncbi:Caspase domain protein [Phycisphaerae bacterium RAS1]|nr:Caspase domain protein [Phycisphaerae bacterium RAS1]